jgi:DNA-binding PadR family transcriptional regulator
MYSLLHIIGLAVLTIFGVLGVLFLILIVIDHFKSPKVTEEDVLQVLGHATWKTGLEIRDELNKLKNVPKDSFFDVSIGLLYAHLMNLEEQTWVERRIRVNISQEQLKSRNGNYPFEYRLTPQGTRKKVDGRNVETLDSKKLCSKPTS